MNGEDNTTNLLSKRQLLRTDAGNGVGTDAMDQPGLELRIVDTNAPVTGGDRLEITATVENTGDTTLRPDIEWIVDGDHRLTLTTTVHPGETKPLDYLDEVTYPAEQDYKLSLELRSEGAIARQTVDIGGVETLSSERAIPNTALTIRTGSRVMFEIDWPTRGQNVTWFLDDDYQDESIGPRRAQFPNHYWQHTFDTPGTYKVAGAIDESGGNLMQTWTVEVSSDGPPSPTIDDVHPPKGTALERGEPHTVEVTVSDTTRDLDRVVWWLAHTDELLGISELSGNEATATLDIEANSYDSPIVVWVLNEDNVLTTEQLWEVTASGKRT